MAKKFKYIKKIYHKYRLLITIVSIVILLSAIFYGIYFYDKKIEKLNTELERTKLQAISEKQLSEEELAAEIAKTKDAQQKANEEAIKKNEKELELAQKEKTEKELNTDKDGDGLTYRQEISYGTSDSNTDSDNDGIIDGQDMHPAGGDRPIAQHFEWSYLDESWEWDFSFPSDWYDYYKNKSRVSQGIAYVTSDDLYIKKIADMLKKTAEEKNYVKSAFAVSFVQSLGYVDDDLISYNDYPKYPLETLAEQNGDCEDTSYLSAAIISAMGIDCSLVLLPGHMSIAIAFSNSPSGYYYSNNNRDYYYIETTGNGWEIGDMPSEYKNTKAKLLNEYYNEAEVYPSYRKPCEISSDFIGYYYDGQNYYSDNQCNNLTYCLSYEELYYNIKTQNFYWDNNCAQVVTKGCYKSTSYTGYFINGIDYYNDSKCTQKAAMCRAYSGGYWDGFYFYSDRNCTHLLY